MSEIKLYNTGVVAGNFDVIHPGYIKLFKQMKDVCENVIILLHTDPSIERPEKLKPILSVQERDEILMSIKYIDNVFTYTTEKELFDLLQGLNPDVRFLGDDYKDKPYTGYDLRIPILYINRSHGWSTTKYKELISKSL